ncbi:PREDICTED: uncharacterized protein LOC107104015 isoform X2 [Cyprinodon variegatus]|uniref:uncharacterized protein LOC107104015 isoform X2 n=1 Tax=Cyprinodon variegatus TaxID=28743 RepID=UPI00074280B8|nr:PREDICTED: uncharacterized protein LOC107104015 isoform X2 [Cyprinodon variegatus]
MPMTSTSLGAGLAVNQSNFRPWARLRSPATQAELDTKRLSASCWKMEKRKDPMALSIQGEALDRVAGNDWSDLHQSPTSNSSSHNAELQEGAFPVAYFTAPGTSRSINHHLHPSEIKEEDVNRRFSHHDTVDLTRFELEQRTEALEQLEQMKILEWENRMKVLAWEQELVREKRKAARQKQKAFRMKKAYYKAKLKRLGEDVPPSSSSSGEEEEKISELHG